MLVEKVVALVPSLDGLQQDLNFNGRGQCGGGISV